MSVSFHFSGHTSYIPWLCNFISYTKRVDEAQGGYFHSDEQERNLLIMKGTNN